MAKINDIAAKEIVRELQEKALELSAISGVAHVIGVDPGNPSELLLMSALSATLFSKEAFIVLYTTVPVRNA